MTQHDGSDGDCCRLTVLNDLAYLPVILDFVRSAAGVVGFGDGDQQRIELAVEEAATNVIQHAFAPGEAATFDVACQHVPNGLAIRIQDKGLPFDPSLAPEYDPTADLENQEGAGLGGFMIRQLMDEYQFLNLGAEGKATRLVKYLDTPSVADEDPGEREPEAPEPAPARQAEPVELEVRRMRREEAIEVARCVYDSYGYSWCCPFVLDS